MRGKTVAMAREVSKDWIDYNGHMGDWAYIYAFGEAIDKDMESFGLDHPYRERTGCTMYTMSSLIQYRREIKLGDPITITSYFADLDRKRVHFGLEMFDAQDQLVAMYEALVMHVRQTPDSVTAADFPEDMFSELEARFARDQTLPKPALLGAGVGIRRKD